MQRIDGPSVSQRLPAPKATYGTPGYFTEGDPSTSTAPTLVTADFLNMLQEEFIAVLRAANIAPDKSNWTQLRDAITTLVGGAVGYASDAEAVQGQITNKALNPHGGAALVADRIASLVDNAPAGRNTLAKLSSAIDTAIAGLLGGAPAALDTLKELADAINDDASFAATVIQALAQRMQTTWMLSVQGGLLTGGGDGSADRTIGLTRADASTIRAGTDDSSVATPAGLASLPKSFAANGYATVFGGLILQWVTGAGDNPGTESSQTIVYPIAFPNAVLGAFPITRIPYATNGADAFYQLIGEPDVSSVTVQRQLVPNPTDKTVTTPRVLLIGF